jgi:hypothetical protein
MTELTPLPDAGNPAGLPAAIDRAAAPPDDVVVVRVEAPQDFEAGRVRAQLLRAREHDRLLIRVVGSAPSTSVQDVPPASVPISEWN